MRNENNVLQVMINQEHPADRTMQLGISLLDLIDIHDTVIYLIGECLIDVSFHAKYPY